MPLINTDGLTVHFSLQKNIFQFLKIQAPWENVS